MLSKKLNYFVDVMIVMWLFAFRTCEGCDTAYETQTDYARLGNLTSWLNYSTMNEILAGGLSKQKVMLNSGAFWAPVVPGLLDIRPIMRRWHGVSNMRELYDPKLAHRPLIPDRLDETRAMPAHVMNRYIKIIAEIALVPMYEYYTVYSMRIGHATHFWESGVDTVPAAKKFRWENQDSRKDMYNVYGARHPRICQRKINLKVSYAEASAQHPAGSHDRSRAKHAWAPARCITYCCVLA